MTILPFDFLKVDFDFLLFDFYRNVKANTVTGSNQ